ncbi:nicotinamide mononucleotide transporter, partial [Streptosporangium algeriense]
MNWVNEGFQLLGVKVLWTDLVGNVAALATVLLAIRRSIWTWPVQLTAAVLLFATSLSAHITGNALKQLMFGGLAVYGWWAARLLGLARLAGSRLGGQEGTWSYVETEEWLLATSVTRDGTTSRMVPWVVSRWTPEAGRGTYLRTRRPGRPFEGGGWAGIT